MHETPFSLDGETVPCILVEYQQRKVERVAVWHNHPLSIVDKITDSYRKSKKIPLSLPK